MIIVIDIKEILQSGIKELDLHISNEQINTFERFMDLMLEWNEKINLTAITEPTQIVTKHFLDSLLPLVFVDKYQLNLDLIIDIGTGGGFPGIPLKIMQPEKSILLADSLKKRISYLEIVIAELKFSKIETHHGRAEEMGKNPEFREKFTAVFSRAVAAMNILLEYSLPFLQIGGIFVALKGPTYKEELEEAKDAIQILGGELLGVEEVTLPLCREQRSLIFIKKVNSTPRKYPRKPGTPKKLPLR